MKVYVSVQIVDDEATATGDVLFNMRLCRRVNQHNRETPHTALKLADEMWGIIREEVERESL